MDGDLRTGLPSQMINIHDPLRIAVIIEHHSEVVLDIIQKNPSTFQWFHKNWVWLIVIDPITKNISVFDGEKFEPYEPIEELIIDNQYFDKVLSSNKNLPIIKIKN